MGNKPTEKQVQKMYADMQKQIKKDKVRALKMIESAATFILLTEQSPCEGQTKLVSISCMAPMNAIASCDNMKHSILHQINDKKG